jgi:predicted TPR repeat methyltransferase
MSVDPQTIQTYDDAAEQMAVHFQQYKDGVAREEINKAFSLAQRQSPRVVEIGCGAGKDAAEISKRASQYEGFDPSMKLLEIAKAHVPEASFVQADALSYAYPPNNDIIFAFASLLHLNKKDFATVCHKISTSLRQGGVLCMSLKEADAYTEQVQKDEFGIRRFYLYPPELVQELTGPSLRLVDHTHTTAGAKAKKWMSLFFVKH